MEPDDRRIALGSFSNACVLLGPGPIIHSPHAVNRAYAGADAMSTVANAT
jgi:hypothetical protein